MLEFKVKRIFFVVCCLVITSSGVQNTQSNDVNSKSTAVKSDSTEPTVSPQYLSEVTKLCESQTNKQCSELSASCLRCDFNMSCVYGTTLNVTCTPLKLNNPIKCEGEREFNKSMVCRYCYQADHWEYECVHKGNCNTIDAPRMYYRTNCTTNEDVLCLGRRVFKKNLPCNWSGGYRWSTALFLSITLGGFGADRFYLGHWQEAIGKIFSFGGLGVWTLIDVILISLRYLGPADGSLYI